MLQLHYGIGAQVLFHACEIGVNDTEPATSDTVRSNIYHD